jgi:hypothetical protein
VILQLSINSAISSFEVKLRMIRVIILPKELQDFHYATIIPGK